MSAVIEERVLSEVEKAADDVKHVVCGECWPVEEFVVGKMLYTLCGALKRFDGFAVSPKKPCSMCLDVFYTDEMCSKGHPLHLRDR